MATGLKGWGGGRNHHALGAGEGDRRIGGCNSSSSSSNSNSNSNSGNVSGSIFGNDSKNSKIRPNTTNDLLTSIAHVHQASTTRISPQFSFDDQSDSSSEGGTNSCNNSKASHDSSSNHLLPLPIHNHYPTNLRLGSPSRSRTMAAFVLDSTATSDGKTNAENPHLQRNSLRPRAPRSKLKTMRSSDQDPSGIITATPTSDTNPVSYYASGGAPSEKQKNSNRKPKAKNISELLDNLQHFDKTNMSRSLMKSAQDEIHYVNLDSKKVAPSESNPSAYFKASRHKKPAQVLNLASFSIPELPAGKTLTFNILSTWGDPHYVGLMGIEIFDKSGHLVKIPYPDKQIWADPPDINILPEYGHDPRTVDNIVDGINLTCDDLHAWLAPFTSGENHFLFIEFDEITTISMIRIWNYNKSRIHSHRGARYVEIMLGDRSIFKGEIKQAPGIHSILNFEDCCECILFTRNTNILMLIERYDPVLEEYNAAVKEQELSISKRFQEVHRPILHSRHEPKVLASGRNGAKEYIGSSIDDDDDEEEEEEVDEEDYSNKRSNNYIKNSKTNPNKVKIDAVERDKGSSSPSSTLPFESLTTPRSTGSGDNRPSTRAGRVTKNQDDKAAPTSLKTENETVVATISTVDNEASHNKIGIDGDFDPLDDSVDLSSLPYKMTPLNISNRDASSKSKDSSRPSTASIARRNQPCAGRFVDVCVLSSWGSQDLIGVTYLSGVDEFMQEFVLPVPKVLVSELFKNDMGGYELKVNEKNALLKGQMSNYPDIIVDGHTQTSDSRDMWSALKPQKGCLVFRFDLKKQTRLKGLKIWNYNASGEDALLGFKHVQLYIDGVMLSAVLVRKAPGVENVDYAQFLPLVKLGDVGGVRTESTAPMPLSSSSANNSNSKSLANLLESIPNINESIKFAEYGGNQAPSSKSSFYSKYSSNTTNNNINNNNDDDNNNNNNNNSNNCPSNDSNNKNNLKAPPSDISLVQYNWTNPVGASSRTLSSSSSFNSQPPEIDLLASLPSNSRLQNGDRELVLQTILLCPVPQQYETPVHPCGCMIKIVINSTHGDRFYVGLNGVEIYDERGFKVDIDSSQIQAFPYRDINDLEEIRKQGQDVRVLQNLINPINNTFNDRYMWLVPFAGPNSEEKNRLPNSILIMLDEPVSISCVKIWNYAKTSERGAKEVEVFLDDGLIFRGNLLKSPSKDELQSSSYSYDQSESFESINWGSGSRFDLSQVILFTDKEEIIEKERHRVPMAVDCIEFIDEGRNVKPEAPLTRSSRSDYSSSSRNVPRPMTTSTGNRLDKAGGRRTDSIEEK